MLISTSTPGSIVKEVICLTTSAGAHKSKILLWTLICQRSKVLVPSPQGDLRNTIFKCLVGIRTGPATFNNLDKALAFNSAQTFSTDATLVEVRVILMRWTWLSSAFSSKFAFTGGADILIRQGAEKYRR